MLVAALLPLEADEPNPLSITRIVINANQTELQWTGGNGPYRIQWRPELGSGNWEDVGAAVNGTNRFSIVNSSNAFFRVFAEGQPTVTNARYSVGFSATWSSATHPAQFPSGAHFSGLIGATHNSQFSMWAPGAGATPGIESMAETGSKFTLMTEGQQAIAAGTAQHVLSGGGTGSPGSVGMTFDISRDHSLVSLVSMIAPSPDWFVGVHDLDLCANGQWIDQVVVPLQPYDSGTDSGLTYSSFNANTVPAQPISEITGFPFAVSGPVPALGTFTFTRVN
ncbi:MAG: spondin domain-containing protein [Limisphaerales bacterium]